MFYPICRYPLQQPVQTTRPVTLMRFNNINLINLLAQAQLLLKSAGKGAPLDMPGANPLNTLAQQGQNMMEGKLPLSALFGNESLLMNPQELSQFLKDSLQLPKELRLALLMLAMESSPKELKPLLDQGLKQIIEQQATQLSVPVEDLQNLLNQNTKEATEKLMKLLQGNQMSQTRSGQQIAELVVSLGKLGEKIKLSPKDAMETMMLLYIPWYPLAAQQKLELSFEMGEGGEEGGDRDVSVVLYIETNSLGRFKLVVKELEALQLLVIVMHEAFVKELMPRLEKQMNGMLAEDGLPACYFESEVIRAEKVAEVMAEGGVSSASGHGGATSESLDPDMDPATAGFKQATRRPDQKQINIQAGDRVSVLVLNYAYALARFIFEADEENRVLQKNQ